MKIAESLVEQGIITQQQLDAAVLKQKESGENVDKILIASGAIEEHKYLQILAKRLQVPFVDLEHYELNLTVAGCLPENEARLFHAIVLAEEDDNSYLVGMIDPQDIFAIDELFRILKKQIKPVLIAEDALLHCLDSIYRNSDEINSFAAKLATELKPIDLTTDTDTETDTAVLKLINSLFESAVHISASDIHIEPDERVMRIRFRVDGFLQEQIIRGTNIAQAISQRLKLMAGLNIAEKRLPQDGRFNITINNMPVDVRISTMPIQHGESIVMRLLNKATGILNLDKVGMPKDMLQRLRHLIRLPKGMILVTGPTGSGKTTTLYAALNEMNDAAKKFITIEDPVEYRLPRINQVQINQQLDLTFARVLRTALRQDPDIILVGEIRDQETASIALRAALTGHLVLATLHTNDAASTAMRLLDMGVEGYLVAATICGALAQRLVRRICNACQEEYQPSPEEINFFTEFYGKNFATEHFVHGKGCKHCNHSGYRGRIGIFELLEFTEEQRAALRNNDADKFMQLVNKEKSEHSLLANAYKLACQGITTLSETIRVAGEQA
jgi:MSHA biogenesis protein MshE